MISQFFRKKRYFESWNPDLDPHKRKTISNLYEYAIMNADLWTKSESLLLIFFMFKTLKVILSKILTIQITFKTRIF